MIVTVYCSTIRSRVLCWLGRVAVAMVVAVVLVLLAGVLPALSDVSLGGLVSEKLLGRSGVADSSLLLGRSGTNTELSVLGFAPVVSTQPATSTSGTTATLRGRITNMNGMPSTRYYFEWGYSATALTNTTTPVTVTTTGDYSTNISGITGVGTLYYRFATDADGTAYGAVSHFPASSGAGGFILKSLLRVILAGAILIGVIMIGRRGGTVALLVSAVIGIIAFVIVNSVISTLF